MADDLFLLADLAPEEDEFLLADLAPDYNNQDWRSTVLPADGKAFGGFRIRAPVGEEENFFRRNPDVPAYASEDGFVVFNPFVEMSEKDRRALAINESARLLMKRDNIEPLFELTPRQRAAFSTYGEDEVDARRTIVGRILSDDPTALDATQEQRVFAESLRKRLGINSESTNEWRLAALPALGEVKLDEPSVSPASSTIEDLLRMTMSERGLADLEEYFPRGLVGHSIDAAATNAAQPFVGLAEEVGLLTEGTTQELVQDIQEDRTALAARSKIPEVVVGLSGTAEVAGALAPGFGAAKGTMAAAKAAGKTKEASRLLAARIGVPTEAMLQGYFSSAGVPWEERWKVMALSGAIGAGGGILATRGAIARTAKEAADEVRLDAAVDAAKAYSRSSEYGDPASSILREIREQADTLRNEDAADRFARLVTEQDWLKMEDSRSAVSDLIPIEVIKGIEQSGAAVNLLPSAYVERLAAVEGVSGDVVKLRLRAGVYAGMVPELKAAEATLLRYEGIVREGGESPRSPEIDSIVSQALDSVVKWRTKLDSASVALADIEGKIDLETSVSSDSSLTSRVNRSLSDSARVFHDSRSKILSNMDKELESISKARESAARAKSADADLAREASGVAVPISRTTALPDKFTKAEDAARSRAENLLTEAENRYTEKVDKINYDSPAAKALAKLLSDRDRILADVELSSKSINTLESNIRRAEEAMGIDPLIARGEAAGMTARETIIDMVDRSAREKVAEAIAEESEAAVFNYLGIGKEDLLNLPVERIVEMRDKISSSIEVMENSRTYAEQMWERLKSGGASDTSAVSRLRNNAALAEIFRAEDAGFDKFDQWYRERNYERNSLRPDTEGMSRPPRQTADALSEYKDAIVAVTEKVRLKATEQYSRLYRAKDESLLAGGEVVTRDQFVAGRVAEAQQAIDSGYRSILSEMKGQSEPAVIRALDSLTETVLRQHRIDKSSVGFRGGNLEHARLLRNEAATWLDGQIEGRGLSSLSDGQIVELGKKARDSRAPDVVFEWLEAELQRRRSRVPLAPRLQAADASPDAMLNMARERIAARAGNEAADEMLGVRKTPELGVLERGARRVERWARTMFSSRRQLGPGRWFLSDGISTEQATMTIADRARRKIFRSKLDNLITERDVIREQIGREAAVMDRDLSGAIGKHIKRQRDLGNNITEHEFRQQLYEARNSGKVSEIQDPEFLRFYNEEFLPFHRSLQERAATLVKDPFERAKVLHEMDNYLHRRYSIFSVKDGAYKQIDTTSEAFKRYFSRKLTEDYDKLRVEAYNEHSSRLREKGLGEEEISELLDIFVESRVFGEIESQVRQGLKLENRRFGSKVLGEPSPDYLKERVIEDADFREIMGEVKDIKYSAATFAHGLAHDVSSYILRADLIDLFRKSGLILNKALPGYSRAISSSTLKSIGDPGSYLAAPGERVVYTSPEVAAVLEGVQSASTMWDKTITKAVGRVKSGFVLTGANAAQQIIGMIHMIVNSGGWRGLAYLLNPRKIIPIVQGAKEAARPGTTGLKADGSGILKELGAKTQEETRAIGEELLKYRLDRGNEFAYEMEMVSRPSLLDAQVGKGGAVRAYDRGVHFLTSWWKIPDVTARAVAWFARIDQLTALEGLSAPTERIKLEAAEYARNTTQDPTTTPTIVRNIGKSLPLAGFQSWGYQMGRNFLYTYGYAAKDMMTGAKYIAAGETAKGSRYMLAGANRAAIMTATTFFLVDWLSDRSDEDKKRAVAARDVLWANQRNANILLGSTLPGFERPGFERRDGRIIMNYIDTSSVDIQANTKKILSSIVDSVSQKDPSIFLKEFSNQYFEPSFFVTAMMDLAGMEVDRETGIPSRRSSIGREDKLFDIPVVGGIVTKQGVAKAAGRVMPGMARFATDVAVDPALRSVFGEEAGFRRLDPQDPIQDRNRMQMIRQGTGVSARSVDYGKMLARRFNEEYDSNAIWISQLKKEWASASTWDAETAVIKRNEKKWNDFYKTMKMRVDNALATGAVDSYDLGRILSSEYGKNWDNKYGGYKIRPGINRRMQNSLQYGMELTLRDYLSGVRKNESF